MRRFWLSMTVAALAMSLAAIGCSSSEDGAETASNQAADAKPAAEAKKAVDDHAGHDHAAGGAEVEMASMTMTGTMGCGHCNFQTTDGCAVAFKTSDGEIVLVEGGPDHAKLMEVRMDQPTITVAGRVTTQDGLKIIHADSYELN